MTSRDAELVAAVRSADPTRLVDEASGWDCVLFSASEYAAADS